MLPEILQKYQGLYRMVAEWPKYSPPVTVKYDYEGQKIVMRKEQGKIIYKVDDEKAKNLDLEHPIKYKEKFRHSGITSEHYKMELNSINRISEGVKLIHDTCKKFSVERLTREHEGKKQVAVLISHSGSWSSDATEGPEEEKRLFDKETAEKVLSGEIDNVDNPDNPSVVWVDEGEKFLVIHYDGLGERIIFQQDLFLEA